jgi:altronate dehydratase small subunit
MEAGTDVEVRLGEEVTRVKALEKIPFGFKIALTDIPAGAHILKYGESIGLASALIRRGDLVHVHNLEGGKGRGDLAKGGSK